MAGKIFFIVLSLFGIVSSQFESQRSQQAKSIQYQSKFNQQDFQSIPRYQVQENLKSQREEGCDKTKRYPVDGYCDRYLECEKGQLVEKTCPDGLLYNPEVGYRVYPCQYPIDVECLARSSIQPPQPTEDCPHQFGYYRLGDAKNCSHFRNCVNGQAFDFTCPEGLAFSPETYRCDWPDQVKECDAEAFLGFSCPQVPLNNELGAPAGYRSYSNQLDCQKYFICVDGRPRISHCDYGRAFDEASETCIVLTEVLSCPETLRNIYAEEERARNIKLQKLGAL